MIKEYGRLVFVLFMFFAIRLSAQQENITVQPENQAQLQVATRFLDYLMKGQSDECWKLFDRVNVPDISRVTFDNTLQMLRKDLSIFDTCKLMIIGVKLNNDKKMAMYTFRAVATTKNIIDNVMIEVLFFESSDRVASVRPMVEMKGRASMSPAEETPIVKDTTIAIAGISYMIRGIHLIHFEHNGGLLAIQVQSSLPTDNNLVKVWAKEEGLKFARFLYQNSFMQRAEQKAKELSRKLQNTIGVSFYDIKINRAYNVIFKAEEYNK